MCKISVIIPCYNCSATIEKAIISLNNQRYKDFEIILIDDGSTDGTNREINILKRKYDLNYKIIVQCNKGVATARNVGIENASGEFITFLDADDIYDEYYLELLADSIQNNHVDLVMCQHEIVDSGSIVSAANNDGECLFLNIEEMIRLYIHHKRYHFNFVDAIYRKSIIVKYNIAFDIELRYGEDALFFCEYASHCNNGAIFMKRILYKYVRTNKSATKNISYRRIDVIKATGLIIRNQKKYITDDEEKYFISRAVWAIAKDFSMTNYDLLKRLESEYNVRSYMEYLKKNEHELLVKITSWLYCVNKYLFYCIFRALGGIYNRRNG